MPSPTRDRRILWNRQGINYLLLDRFTTPATAPLTSPRNCEPGPGQLTIADPNNIISISGGQLVINGTGTSGGGTRVVANGTFTRASGNVFLLRSTNRVTTPASYRWGLWTGGNNMDAGFQMASTDTAQAVVVNGAGVNSLAYTPGAALDFGVVERTTGAFLLCKESTSSQWDLLWVHNANSAASPPPGIACWNAAANMSFDDFRWTALGPPWNTDYGAALSYSATTANGDTLTGAGDGLVEHTITAATGVTQELSVRYVDDNNRWIVRCDQGGSTVALIEKNGGAETSRGSAAQTWTNGTQYRVVVVQRGTSMKVFVANISKITYTIANGFNLTATGVKVSHAGTGLVCWPRNVTLPAV